MISDMHCALNSSCVRLAATRSKRRLRVAAKRLFVVVLATTFANIAVAGEQVTVTLVGGAKVTASLLRESDEGIVLDLGYEVLNVPQKIILDIDRKSKASKVQSQCDRGIFTTAKLDAADLPVLVQ